MGSLTLASTRSLILAARSAKRRAFAPYSRFRVGAALLTSSGHIVSGCNVENSSYGLTMCAERVALFTALASGHTSFSAIAISSDADAPLPPCGACRQVLAEHAPGLLVILDDGKRSPLSFDLSSLLPRAFQAKHLKKKRKH